MDEKQCLECGGNFFGRADKKFCSDACRNAYHNSRSGEEEVFMKKVNRILRKNRQILSDQCPGDKTTMSYIKLASEGLDFSYFTSSYVTKEGKEYRFCYDMGYLKLNPEFILIVRRDEPS